MFVSNTYLCYSLMPKVSTAASVCMCVCMCVHMYEWDLGLFPGSVFINAKDTYAF